MSGTSEGGKKAAAHQDMSEKGRKGAEALNADDKKSAAAQKTAETRKKEDPVAFQKTSEKSESHSHGGTNKQQED